VAKKDLKEKVIQRYQNDEKMMVLVFAQWCVNHGLDPEELYRRAYPRQEKNLLLKKAIERTLPKEEAGDISNDTVLNVLSLFGNGDLAFVVFEEIQKFHSKSK